MDSSSSKNINIAGTPSQNGLPVVGGSNPSVGQVSNSSLNINIADGSMRSRISNPSLSGISAVHQSNNKAFRAFIGGLVVVTLVLLVGGLYHTYKAVKANKDTVSQKLQEAAQDKAIISQSIRQSDDFAQDAADISDNTVILSLYSDPSGAEVYKDGEFVGVTPIEDMKFKKAQNDADIVLSLEEYNVARLTFDMSQNFSENITLEHAVVERDHRSSNRAEAAAAPAPSDGSITSAKAKVVGGAADTKSNNRKGKGKSDAPAAPAFVIPE